MAQLIEFPIKAATRAGNALVQPLRSAWPVHSVDDYGRDPHLISALAPLAKLRWDVTVGGEQHLPVRTGALLVCNTRRFSLSTVYAALALSEATGRPVRFVGRPDIAPVGPFMRRIGGMPANQANLKRLLESDEQVMVFPEGAKGFGKPYSERYQLQRFGRGGFVEVALETGTPIVPVAVVGSEEIYPKLGQSDAAAKLLGAPYVPITPTFPLLGPLGLLPLPSRWRIEFLEPVDLSEYGPGASEDRSLVLDISEQVRGSIQEALYDGLLKRGPAFL